MSRPEEGEETIGGHGKEKADAAEAPGQENARREDRSDEQVEYAKNPRLRRLIRVTSAASFPRKRLKLEKNSRTHSRLPRPSRKLLQAYQKQRRRMSPGQM